MKNGTPPNSSFILLPSSFQGDQGESRTPTPVTARGSEPRVYTGSTTWSFSVLSPECRVLSGKWIAVFTQDSALRTELVRMGIEPIFPA